MNSSFSGCEIAPSAARSRVFCRGYLTAPIFPSFQGSEISPRPTMTRIFCMSNLTVRRGKFPTPYYPFSAE